MDLWMKVLLMVIAGAFAVMAWGFQTWASAVADAVSKLEEVHRVVSVLENDIGHMRRDLDEHSVRPWHDSAGRAILQLEADVENHDHGQRSDLRR